MALYTVHIPGPGSDAAALERAVLLKEGFSWPAFILSGFWLLWKRLWLGFVGFLALGAAIGLLATALGLPSGASALLELALALMLGLEGQSLARAKLERRGYRFAGVVSAVTLEEAERKAIDLLRTPAAVSGMPLLRPDAAAFRRPGHDGIVGLFPHPGANG